MLKKISVLALVLVMIVSVFSISVLANEPSVTVNEEPESKDIEEKPAESVEVDRSMQFKPMEFVKNLGIMGVGMVGIFVVIGAIIVSVAVLNKLTSPKKESNE